MLLIFETITWKPHIETAIEIALTRRDDGDEVIYCNLRNALPACEDESRLHALLDLPGTRIRRAKELLEQRKIAYLSPSYTNEAKRIASDRARTMLGSCDSIEHVKQLSHDEFFDIGWGVISSIVSVTGNSAVTPATHRVLFQEYCTSAILVYEKACELIDRLRPSEVLLFNGRFATTRAVLRAAQSRGVPWRIHERGGSKDRYLVIDFMPHDMDRIQETIQSSWSKEHTDSGHAFFHARRNRVERAWHSFTRAQDIGRLPPAMSEPGDWVTFFTSSEDEMIAIGDNIRSKTFPTQLDAIKAAAEAVDSIDGTRLCVRIHPHVAQKSRADRKKWSGLNLPGVLVIGPEDKADSYALIDHSRVVCSYGSTVGIEATYWGRPSLLFGRSFYDRLGVCDVAVSVEQVQSYLRNPSLYPQRCTLPYGAFWERLGEPYRHYAAEGLHRGRIGGIYLDDSASVRAVRWVANGASRLGFGKK